MVLRGSWPPLRDICRVFYAGPPCMPAWPRAGMTTRGCTPWAGTRSSVSPKGWPAMHDPRPDAFVPSPVGAPVAPQSPTLSAQDVPAVLQPQGDTPFETKLAMPVADALTTDA